MKKLFILILLPLLFLGFTTPARADLTVETYFSNQNIKQQNQDKFNLRDVQSAAAAIAANIGGNSVDGKPGNTSGALPELTKVMTAMITVPPAHTATYVADVIHNLRMPGTQPAYAQGVGFSGLLPVLNLWKAFRNLAYFAFIIVFVIIGFMIMFRHKIDSHTVATVQESLPKIILTLILITFSYAIAGFVLDLMYLSIFIITGLFESFNIIGSAEKAQNAIFSHNIVGLGIQFLIGPSQAGGEASQAVSHLLAGAINIRWLSGIINILAYLIILVAILIAVFRTLFTLVSAYVNIIISVIFAPITLLMNAFPGNDSFKTWIQGLVANAAIFPTAAVMLILGAALVGNEGNFSGGLGLAENATNGFGWLSSGAGGFVPPLVGSANVEVIRAVIGLGFILLLPEVTKMVHEALSYKAPWFGEAAQKNFGAGWEHSPVKPIVGLPGTFVKTAGQYAMNVFALQGAEDALARAKLLSERTRQTFRRMQQDPRDPMAPPNTTAGHQSDYNPPAPENPQNT